METQHIIHNFEPIYNEHSKILMLGTMPSPKSREQGFYYGHPRNRFWSVLADILGEPAPGTIEEKKSLALRRRIAVWDVLAGCDICGAADRSMKNPVPNDIRAVFTTGTKADELYERYCFSQTEIASIRLPSTSPANCRTSYEELRAAYSQILKYL